MRAASAGTACGSSASSDMRSSPACSVKRRSCVCRRRCAKSPGGGPLALVLRQEREDVVGEIAAVAAGAAVGGDAADVGPAAHRVRAHAEQLRDVSDAKPDCLWPLSHAGHSSPSTAPAGPPFIGTIRKKLDQNSHAVRAFGEVRQDSCAVGRRAPMARDRAGLGSPRRPRHSIDRQTITGGHRRVQTTPRERTAWHARAGSRARSPSSRASRSRTASASRRRRSWPRRARCSPSATSRTPCTAAPRSSGSWAPP